MKLDTVSNSRQSTTEDILRISRSEDRACFVRLFIDFAPRVKAYLCHQGLSPEAAEDLAQETLINVWRVFRLAKMTPFSGISASKNDPLSLRL